MRTLAERQAARVGVEIEDLLPTQLADLPLRADEVAGRSQAGQWER
jgi:hypothetical protein